MKTKTAAFDEKEFWTPDAFKFQRRCYDVLDELLDELYNEADRVGFARRDTHLMVKLVIEDLMLEKTYEDCE